MTEERSKKPYKEKNLNQANPYKGAVILTLASIVTKFLSAVYKVPLQNLTGDQGFYVYQQVYPLYGIAVVFTFSGLPIFISKLLSESQSEKDRVSQLQSVFTLTAILSVSAWAILFFFSETIASWMGDPQLAGMVQVVSFFYLFIPIIACLRGFFQSDLQMIPTSVSQVVEQIIRIAVILLAAILYTRLSWSVHQMGQVAMSSAVVSAFISAGFLAFFLKKEGGSLSQYLSFKKPTLNLAKRLSTEGLQMVLLFGLMLLFQVVDAFTIFNALTDRGLPADSAMVLKGIYDRAQPFAQLGLTIALAISSNMLPQLTHLFKKKAYRAWADQASASLKLTMILASATSLGLITVMPWLNLALFSDQEGNLAIQVYLISVFFVSISLAIQSILQSTSVNTFTSFAILFVTGSKAIMNAMMVRSAGIVGSSLVTAGASALLTLLMTMQVPRTLWRPFFKVSFLVKYVIANVVMALSVVGLRNLFTVSGRLEAFVGVIGLASIGVVIYVGLVLRLKLLTHEEVDLLPFSHFLKKVGGYNAS